MPWVFGRGSRSRPVALVSDQPIPASTGSWCRQEMACSGKPCRQSANLSPVPSSSTSKRNPLASTNLVCILAHADRLGINLDQLGERVLKPPRDRDRSAQRHVKPRQLLRGENRSGV